MHNFWHSEGIKMAQKLGKDIDRKGKKVYVSSQQAFIGIEKVLNAYILNNRKRVSEKSPLML